MAKSKRVLVVDDIKPVRESLRIALTEVGHDVVTADAGAQALDLLAQDPFDVLVTDIWMPGVDGLTLVERTRTTYPRLRVFAMTGGGPRMTIETATTLAEVWGAETVFVKPSDERLLIAEIG